MKETEKKLDWKHFVRNEQKVSKQDMFVQYIHRNDKGFKIMHKYKPQQQRSGNVIV